MRSIIEKLLLSFENQFGVIPVITLTVMSVLLRIKAFSWSNRFVFKFSGYLCE